MGKQHESNHKVTASRTGAGRRAVESRLPKIIETPKRLLALKGHATSAIATAALEDICALKRPLCKKLQRKNDILPFEAGGESHLENLLRLNDCSMFALVNSTKKRPHNLILGRAFGHRILDMLEFGIVNYAPTASFDKVKSAPGSKPLLLFNGDDFEADPMTRNMKSLLLDVFRGPDDVQSLNLAGVDRVIVFTLQGASKVQVRHYGVRLQKSAESRLPKPVLKEVGPRFDLEVRRTQLASEALMKEAMKKPKNPRVGHKTKNVTRDDMGDKKGRVHVGKQDLSGLALAKMKGLKKRGAKEDGAANVEADGAADNESPDANLDEDMVDVENASSPVGSPKKRRKVEAS